MALTRKLLKGMGLTDEQVDTIIEAHTDTVDGLKADVSKYKADAEKLPGIQKQLDDLKAAGDGGYKEKYEKNIRILKLISPASPKRKARRQRKRLSGLTLRAKTSPVQISTLPCADAARKCLHWSWTARKSRTPRALTLS